MTVALLEIIDAAEWFKCEQRATGINKLGLSKHINVDQLKTGRGVCSEVKRGIPTVLHIKISELLMGTTSLLKQMRKAVRK